MHIYFIGIGGSGLSPLAQLALDCGYTVSGSDIAHSHGTNAIEKRGVSVGYRQDGEYILDVHKSNPIDFIVYTAACKAGHKELDFAQKNEIKTGKRHDFINKILQEKKLKMIAIAGTHGKTTTTAMMVWLFQKLNIPCSYLIGSNISFGPAAQYQEGSEYFIYEDDEFDRNFLNFSPYLSLVTCIDYDHPDTYPTKKDYIDAFNQFLSQSQMSEVWADVPEEIARYKGLSFIPKDIIGDDLKLFGLHNRENMRLALQGFQRLFGGAVYENKRVLVANKFPGTQRRFEHISDHIYSDYAHHPTEIEATLQLASEVNGEIVVIYQPHQNLRQHEVKEQYDMCFEGASKIYWLDTYLSREPDGVQILKKEELGKTVKGPEVIYSDLDEKLKSAIDKELRAGKMVVAMGAGSIDNWVRMNFLDKN
jgi:UDP-N-acetylmuramate--alanine ligase